MTADEVAAAVRDCGAKLNQLFARLDSRETPLALCVLKGATFFFADLLRTITFPVEVEFVRASSYGQDMTPSERPEFRFDTGTSVWERDVILVEDIIDSGGTASLLIEECKGRGAASVTLVSLLYKPEAARDTIVPHIYGVEAPNRFVIGYGLDFAQEGRNLNGIYIETASE
jgi:hypoxanthine phosphoribosyltransferase